MDLRKWCYAGIAASGLIALNVGAQGQPAPGNVPNPQGGARYGQRLNTVVATNQPVENYDPLAFYRQNPELMRRYFPHLFKGGADPTAPGGTQPNNSGREQVVLDSFKFQGGTAAEFVDMLKAQVNPPPNIIIAPKLREMAIPEFELKHVTLEDLFQALNNLSEDKSVLWQLSGSTEPIWVLNPAPGGGNTGTPQPGMFPGAGGFTHPVDPLTGMPVVPNNARVCQIMPLGKYLGDYKVEDITTAVKTAWTMMGDDGGAQLKYHTDTKLLIAVGTSAQLSILTQVLSSLETGMSHAAKSTESKAPEAGRKF